MAPHILLCPLCSAPRPLPAPPCTFISVTSDLHCPARWPRVLTSTAACGSDDHFLLKILFWGRVWGGLTPYSPSSAAPLTSRSAFSEGSAWSPPPNRALPFCRSVSAGPWRSLCLYCSPSGDSAADAAGPRSETDPGPAGVTQIPQIQHEQKGSCFSHPNLLLLLSPAGVVSAPGPAPCPCPCPGHSTAGLSLRDDSDDAVSFATSPLPTKECLPSSFLAQLNRVL